MDENSPYYEVKPLPVLVPKGTRPWCGKLLQAVRHVGVRVAVTLVIAGALVGTLSWHQPAEPKDTFWHNWGWNLVEHVGVAFLVSAVVIFAFEWGSEVKHSLDLAGMLANTMNEHIEQVLDASASEAITGAMRKLASANAEQFSAQFRSFANSLGRLHDGGWTAPGYLEFVAWYHEEFTRYAESLAHLSRRIAGNPKAKDEFRLVLRETTDAIDAMLAGITRAMGSCGTYYAISDVFTWTKLTTFHDAQKAALDNGLQIRRIFVIGKNSDSGIPASEISQRMYRHHTEAKNSNCNYRIKIVRETDFKSMAATILTKTEHFGIFKPADAKKLPVVVQVLDAQLLSFRIAGAAEANAVLDAFKVLWFQLPHVITECGEDDPAIDVESDLPGESFTDHSDAPAAAREQAVRECDSPTQIGADKFVSSADVIRDHLMAYRLRQLPRPPKEKPVVWYHGASDIALWTSGGLKEFEQGITEAAKDGIEVKRLFVFNEDPPMLDNEKPDSMFLTLRKHAEISRLNHNYQWRVIRKPTEESLLDKPFALFRNGKDVDVEVARGDHDFGFGAPKALANDLEEYFGRLWRSSKSPD